MTLRALRNQAIVKFLPYKRTGDMIIPDTCAQVSIEAEVVSDGGGNDFPTLAAGVVVYVSRMVGEYFDFRGERFCRVPRSGLMMQEVAQ